MFFCVLAHALAPRGAECRYDAIADAKAGHTHNAHAPRPTWLVTTSKALDGAPRRANYSYYYGYYVNYAYYVVVRYPSTNASNNQQLSAKNMCPNENNELALLFVLKLRFATPVTGTGHAMRHNGSPAQGRTRSFRATSSAKKVLCLAAE